MIRHVWTVLTCIVGVLHSGAVPAAAAPTWPASIDELEDIIMLNTGYRARGFAVAVTPCSFSAQGHGRIAAAEWLRTAFHDMATGSVFQGTGGLDASLVFELGGDNIGPAFLTTLTTFAPFLTSRSSMADIIAAGVYTAVRSCGGPAVPIKAGRIDATSAGPPGVPLPQNSLFTFQQQFERTGFNTTEMIAVTACGHTIGGVHASNFPDIVTVGSAPPDDAVLFDSTTVFDEKIASEYVAGKTTDPLSVGPCAASKKCSDVRVFAADGNATITSMANPATFRTMCRAMLQKMIEVVPGGTVLTDPIAPYDVKPNALQLTLLAGGSSMSFTGEIRVRTTVRPASQVASVQLVYKDRTGASTCGSCTIPTASKGTAAGFDDNFVFYGFSASIPSSSSISAFNVLITLVGGGTELYNNNGAGYPVQDTIMLQSPQSCSNANGLTVVAAVRNTQSAPAVSLILTTKVPRGNGIPVPALQTTTVAMAQGTTVGPYTLYTASSASQNQNTKFDVAIGAGPADTFKNTGDLGATCASLGAGGGSTTTTLTTTTSSATGPSSTAFSSMGCYVDTANPRALSGAVYYDSAKMTVEQCSTSCSKFQYFGVEYGYECYCGNSRDASSVPAAATDCSYACPGNAQEKCGAGSRLNLYKNLQYAAAGNPVVAGYTYQACYSDSTGSRTLADSSTAGDTMTVEACATFCNGAAYFGVEFGRECYCGSTLRASGTQQPATDCSMTCAGNGKEYCGAGNRLNVYKSGGSAASSSVPVATSTTTSATAVATPTTTATTLTTSTTPASSPSSTSTPSSPIAGYAALNCNTDSTAARVLTSKSTSSTTMTYAVCASFCSGFNYLGLEYGSECYCGNTYANPTTPAPAADCNMPCSGDRTQNCGAGNRMWLFKRNTPTTGPRNPTVSGYTYNGCYTDSTTARVLVDKSYTDGAALTVEKCATFCAGYAYFGTEYASECFCGNALKGTATKMAEGDCGMVCSGDGTEWCGSGNRLSLYGKSA